MAIIKKAYADISGQASVDFTIIPNVPNSPSFIALPTTFFPPTTGIFGVYASERFAGQTIVRSVNFDRVSGNPTNPLTLAGNAQDQYNVALFISNDSPDDLPSIVGMGQWNVNVDLRLGEGTLAFKFEKPFTEIGIIFTGIDGFFLEPELEIIRCYCYAANGSLIDTVSWTSGEALDAPPDIYDNGNFYTGIAATEGEEIAGILLEAYDFNGFAVYQIKYDAGAPCPFIEGGGDCGAPCDNFNGHTEIFPLIEDVRTSVQIVTSNLILRNNNSSEQRIVQHEYPLRKYSISKAILTSAELTLLRDFYQTIEGSLLEFGFNDRSDNSATKDDLVLATGAKTWGMLYENTEEEGQFYVCKAYQVGDNIYYRAIQNPTDLRIWDSLDNELDPMDYIESSGYIELPTGSYRASFNFTVSVRMDSDILEDKIISRTINNNKIYALDGLQFSEVKKQLRFYPAAVINDDLNHQLQLDLIWGQSSETEFKTEIITKGSLQETRRKRKIIPEYFVNLPGKPIMFEKQMAYMIALWLNTKGNGLTFDFQEAVSDQIYTSRFDSQILSYTNQSAKMIFEMGALRVKLFKNGEILDGAKWYADNGDMSPSDTEASVLKFANVLKVTTQGGCIYAFTSHDKDLRIKDDPMDEEPVIYRAHTAVAPSAYKSTASMTLDSEEFTTIFCEFDEDELHSGIFDDATIETAVVDWSAPPAQLSEGIDYQRGVVGKITSNDLYYSFEFLSLGAAKVNQQYNNQTTSICPHVFGDSKCKYEPLEFPTLISTERTPTPIAIPVEVIYDETFVLSHFRFGYLVLPNGTRHTINFLEITDDILWVNLFNSILDWPEAGECVLLVEGCLRSFAACKEYNNSINFGGIPTTGNWLPGSYEYISPTISR